VYIICRNKTFKEIHLTKLPLLLWNAKELKQHIHYECVRVYKYNKFILQRNEIVLSQTSRVPWGWQRAKAKQRILANNSLEYASCGSINLVTQHPKCRIS
jgi:hypothetical protein